MYKMLLLTIAVFGVYPAAAANVQRIGNANRYFVFTSGTYHYPKEIMVNVPSSIDESGITLSHDTVILVHGHQANAFNSLNPSLVNAYLQNFDVNVISVDWSAFARLDYAQASAAVASVGISLGDFITMLVNDNKVNLDRLHLVGFNLGAHVVGFAGKRLRGQVARITGLDPAGKQWGSDSGRLDRTDARYVEVIHTDSDGRSANGLIDALGHIDFYPNGGSKQPGCGSSNACSHDRAWELFVATLIQNNRLTGNRCASFTQLNKNQCNGDRVVMGTNLYRKIGSGIYRVNTGSSFPF